MLPPVTDVRVIREVLLTEAGRDATAQWNGQLHGQLHRLQPVHPLQIDPGESAEQALQGKFRAGSPIVVGRW